MKESELDLKQWLRSELEKELNENSLAASILTNRNVKLAGKIKQLDTDTDTLVKSFREQLTQTELAALQKAMRKKGTNDQVYFAVATSIHIRCKAGNEYTEHVVKLPRRHLVINTSPLFHHFYYFPYKYRIERKLLSDETLESWFSWILTMLINEFKM